jgi:hypothetical protein
MTPKFIQEELFTFDYDETAAWYAGRRENSHLQDEQVSGRTAGWEGKRLAVVELSVS